MASASTVVIVMMFTSAITVVIATVATVATVATASAVTTTTTAALTAQTVDKALYLVFGGLTVFDNLTREAEGLA